MDIKQFAKQVRNGDDKFLEEVYLKYYETCIKTLMKHFVSNIDDAQNIYVESFLLLRERSLKRRRNVTATSVKSFLLTTSVNMAKRFHQRGRTVFIEEQTSNPYETLMDGSSSSSNLFNPDVVGTAIELLPRQCYRILKMFYFDNLSIPQIKKRMNYKSEKVTSSKKYKCLEKLKSLLLTMND